MFRVMRSPEERTTSANAPPRRDRLYDAPRDIVDFAFDDSVAAVFPDMIRRSVPGYETVVALSGLIAKRHLRPGGRCYDLGCSLGATTLAVLRAVGTAPCRIVAVDDSRAMIDRARAALAGEDRVHWVHGDIRDVSFKRADAVILNYTLQFLPPDDRLPLLRRVRECLSENGVVVVSEKLVAPGYEQDLHIEFKRANGYSELEISQKRAALENVMRIDTATDHLARLREAGFGAAEMWFRCLNWASFVAWPVAPPASPSGSEAGSKESR